jgi:hypothetical protein
MKQFFKRLKHPFLLFIIPWVFYFSIVWSQAFTVKTDGIYAAYLPHWADGAAHLSYMASFAFRDSFPTVHPLFIGEPYSYSFAADMIGGYLVKLGLPLLSTYSAYGFVLSVLTLISLFILLKKMSHSQAITIIALQLFLWGGGLGFGLLIQDSLHPETVPSVGYFHQTLTQRENTPIVWLNPIVGELIPQRSFLFALPLAAFILIIWYQLFLTPHPPRTWLILLTGVIIGCFPIIHPHTLMILTTVFAWWFLISLYSKIKTKVPRPKIIRHIIQTLPIIIPALSIGGYLILTFIAPVASGFITWNPGWLAPSTNTSWPIFWLINWGVFLPLAFIGTWTAILPKQQLILIPFWIWFIFANLFNFQPYDWDNAKLFTWVYLLLALPAASLLWKMWQTRKVWPRIMAASLFILATLSGGIDSLKMLDTNTYALKLLSYEQVQLADIVKTHTPSSAVILTATTHRHWVPILTGRQIICGYPGWMWTYGFSYQERVGDIQAMYRGSPQAKRLLNHYGITHIVVGPEERAEFAVNDDYLDQNFPLFYDTSTTKIYTIL